MRFLIKPNLSSVLLALTVLLSAEHVVAADKKPVVQISTGEWSPYVSKTLPEQGLLVDITRTAFAAVGYDISLDFYPWARATQLSASGEKDGTIALARLKEREPLFLFSETIYEGRYVLFHLKSRPFQWSTYSDLKSVSMASTLGFGGMGDEFLENERKKVIQVTRYTSDTQSFHMLRAGRIQAVPSDLEVGYVNLRKIFGSDVALFGHNSKPIHVAPYHLVISKKIKNGPRLIEDFNRGLKAIKASGQYDAILNKWKNSPTYTEAVPASYRRPAKAER